MKHKFLLTLALAASWPLSWTQGTSLTLDENFRAPLFAQPAPTSRTLLLPNGKFLKYFGTNTLTDQRTGAITRFLPSGTLDTSFHFTGDYRNVSAAAALPDGKLIVAATRYLYGGSVASEEILRLNGDGSIDSTFQKSTVASGEGTFSAVRVITTQPDGKILVGGQFPNFSGTPRAAIARLLPDGTVDSGFNPPSIGPELTGLWTEPVVLANGQILIAGDFETVGGVARPKLARLNSDGSLDASFQPSGYDSIYPIRGLVVQADGKLVLAARFQFDAGSNFSAAPLFRLNADGSPDTSFTYATSVSDNPISSDMIVQPDGKLIAAVLYSVYRFNADGSLDGSFAPPVLLNATYAAEVVSGRAYTLNLEPDGKILLGGVFTDLNPPAAPTASHFGVARLNPDGSVDSSLVTTHRTGIEKSPISFARLHDASTFVTFGTPDIGVDPPMLFNVGRLLSDGTLDERFSLSPSDPGSVLNRGFLATEFTRTAAGSFFARGTAGFTSTGLRFLANGMEDPSFAWDEATPAQKGAAALPDGKLLLFAETDDQSTVENTLTRLRQSGKIDPAFQLSPAIRAEQIARATNGTNYITQLAIGSRVLAVQPDGKIVFVYLARSDQNFHLVRLQPDGALDVSFTPVILPATDLTVDYPQIFDPVTQITLQPSEGTLHATIPLADAHVQPDGRIVLAGRFTSFAGSAARGLARLNANGSIDSSFNIGGGAQWVETTETPTFFPKVESIDAQVDGRLLIAGTFEAFNGVVLPGIARLNSDGSVDTSFTPLARRLKFADGSARLERQPDGSFLLSGPYSFPGENTPAFIHINSSGGTPIVGSPTLATAVVGQAFNYQIVASGQPTGFSVSGLPPGLTYDPVTGLITGTLTSGSGTFAITITATNAEGTSGIHHLTLTVGAPPVFTSPSSATGHVGQPFGFQLSATNEPSSYRAENLPWGLALDKISGLISGVPTSFGVTEVQLRALNAVGGDTATLTLTIDAGSPPPNDNFAAAEPIFGPSGTVAGTNAQATSEIGEPNHGEFGVTGGPSVWYAWTAPSTRNYTFNTSGSNFPTVIAVYTGSALNNLVRVANHIGYGSSPNQVEFTGLAGTTYKIAVDGTYGATGSLTLNWQSGSPVYATSTFAGNPPGITDGPRAEARFQEPGAVAVDGTGNIYVADTLNHSIRKIDAAGQVTTLAGLPGHSGHADGNGSMARFNLPKGIVCDSSGNLFVADYGNFVIRKITPNGDVTTIAGSPGVAGSADGFGAKAGFTFPSGITADASGNMYVADTYNYTIRKVTTAGLVSTIAGSPGISGSADGNGSAARFNSPTAVAVNAAGNIYVADAGNHTIREITPAGMVSTFAGVAGVAGTDDGTGSGARFNFPTGLAADSSGFIYVADSSNYTVRKVSPGAAVTTFAGSPLVSGTSDGTGSAARFNFPQGLAVTGSGDLYVADSYNHTVRKLTPAALVSTFAGRAAAGSEDGERLQARFSSPWSCALDAAGNLYVADTFNQTIRKITPAGTASTFAGEAGSFGSADGQGSAARFGYPTAVTTANDGTVYIADYSNRTIRKITPGGLVSTLAGSPGQTGSDDGQGSAARFNDMYGITTDGQGNIYVADTSNHTIRKITSAGLVTTIAGLAGALGSDDGIGSAARFNSPKGIAVDNAGNVFVGDTGNYTIRKIAPSGTVSTYAGLAGSDGTVDGTGSAARLTDIRGLAITTSGTLFATDGVVVRQIAPGAMVTTIVGDKTASGSRNGVGTAARFNYQSGLAVDQNANLYIADVSNHTIRLARPVADLQISSAVSRKTHGSAGTFDVNLPLSGEPGVECRASGGAHTLVFTFSNDIAAGNATVTAGNGSVSGSPAFSGRTMTVNLTGVADVQKIALTVSGLTDIFSQALPDTTVSMNVLAGDTNANRNVNAADISQAKSQSGLPVTAANFRTDVNANGSVSAADISQVKANAGHTLPPSQQRSGEFEPRTKTR